MTRVPFARFWLGVHQPNFLTLVAHPLFVSHRRLRDRKTLPRALGPWALDSGAYSEVDLHGTWHTTPAQYAAALTRYNDEIGNLQWAAPQDWTCEPAQVAKTGLSIEEHQRRSVASVLELRALTDAVHIIPVLQGWTLPSYLRAAQMFADAGIDLASEPLVGVGSMCRRQNALGATLILDELVALNGRDARPLRLHAFGFKTQGLLLARGSVHSADSMAWSAAGRREAGCSPSHASESNCLRYALSWREKLLAKLT
ncbi:MAG: hypothetical protein HOV68_05450 [Streptomycetaceae bacterium]|nr:hypothetical protein [Streptomycetaceae bacterium]